MEYNVKELKKKTLNERCAYLARQISRSEEELARKERVLKTLEKSEKAKENIILMLNEKGIVITELEMDMMIEAVVNGFNQGLQKDGDFIESL